MCFHYTRTLLFAPTRPHSLTHSLSLLPSPLLSSPLFSCHSFSSPPPNSSSTAHIPLALQQQEDRQAQHFERRRAEIESDLAELEAKIDAAQLKTDLLDETLSQRLDQMEDAQQHIEEHLEHLEEQQRRERTRSDVGTAQGLLRYLVPLGSLVAGMLWQKSYPALPAPK
jgi:septal ring factor EnvC (AmiA/AmiB activator)